MPGYWDVVKTAATDFLDDDCMSSGAAIAYYTTFSLPPLLTLVFMIAAMAGFTEQQVSQLVERESGLSLSDDQTKSLSQSGNQSADADQSKSSESGDMPLGLGRLDTVSRLIGIALLLFSATGVFGQLQFSLDKAWEVKPDPKRGGLQNFIAKRILSAGLVVVIGFLLMVSLVITTILDGVVGWVAGGSIQSQVLIFALNQSVSLAVATLLFAVMFKVLPDAKIAWRDIWGGAICTAVLFEIGKFAISWYVDSSQIGADWGTAAASVIGALVWVYYSWLIVLFGAELTQAWANQFGHGAEPKPGAVRVVTDERRQDQPASTVQ